MDITVTFVALLTDPNFLHRGSMPTSVMGWTLTITSLPGRYAPVWSRRLLPPVMVAMLEFASDDSSPRRRLYISGDTLLIEELKEIAARFDSIDVLVLHLAKPRCQPAGGFRSG